MSGSISSASMASGSNVAEASGSGTQPLLGDQQDAGAAAFQEAARQTPPAPVEVRRTESFLTTADAARHALAQANPVSIRADVEYGGNLYRYRNWLGCVRFGYTGPERDGTDYNFDAANPAVRPPGDTQLVGIYQTQGAYTQFDPATDSVDRFSVTDLRFQRDIALGVPDESREEREHDIRDTYGVPPVREMQFYIVGPGNIPREHIPARPPSREETAARNPVTNEPIENGGTDRVLRRHWWHR